MVDVRTEKRGGAKSGKEGLRKMVSDLLVHIKK